MPTIEPSGSAAPEIDDGLYVATWLDCEEKYVENDAFGKNHKLEIHLELDLGGGQTQRLDPLVNWAWSEKATLYKFALGFGGVVDLKSAFNTDMMKGRQAQVLVETDFEKSAWPRVMNVLPLKKGKATAAAHVDKIFGTSTTSTTSRAPWEGEAISPDEASAWWKARLGEGFERAAIIALCKEMFEGRIPGELNADELKGLTDQLNETA